MANFDSLRAHVGQLLSLDEVRRANTHAPDPVLNMPDVPASAMVSPTQPAVADVSGEAAPVLGPKTGAGQPTIEVGEPTPLTEDIVGAVADVNARQESVAALGPGGLPEAFSGWSSRRWFGPLVQPVAPERSLELQRRYTLDAAEEIKDDFNAALPRMLQDVPPSEILRTLDGYGVVPGWDQTALRAELAEAQERYDAEYTGSTRETADNMPQEERDALPAAIKANQAALASGVNPETGAAFTDQERDELLARIAQDREVLGHLINDVNWRADTAQHAEETQASGLTEFAHAATTAPVFEPHQDMILRAVRTLSHTVVTVPEVADVALGLLGNAWATAMGRGGNSEVRRPFGEEFAAVHAEIERLFPTDPAREDFFFSKFASGVGSMVAFLAGGFIARALKISVGTGASVTGASSTATTSVAEAESYGATEIQKIWSFLSGLALGATEGIAIDRAFLRFAQDIGHGRFAHVLRTTGASSLEEFIQELGQSFGQDFVARYGLFGLTDGGFDPNRLFDPGSYLEQGFIGAILGATMTAPAAAFAALSDRPLGTTERREATEAAEVAREAEAARLSAELDTLMDGYENFVREEQRTTGAELPDDLSGLGVLAAPAPVLAPQDEADGDVPSVDIVPNLLADDVIAAGMGDGGVEGTAVNLAETRVAENVRLVRTRRQVDTGIAPQGAPANAGRIVLRAPEGRPDFVTGAGATTQDWVTRVEALMTAEEITASANWYTDVATVFQRYIPDPETAALFMAAWLVSQQNASPTSGLKNVLLQAEQYAQGVAPDAMRLGGLPSATEAVRSVLTGAPVTGGVGPKIADFYDSALGADARTWVGGDAAGGRPFVVDVHSARDMGLVDDALLNQLENAGYVIPSGLKRDFNKGGVKGHKYEHAADRGRRLTDELNAAGWQGRSDWAPHEIQAIGWASIIQMLREKPMEDANTAWMGNRSDVSFELEGGEGSSSAEVFSARLAELDPTQRAKIQTSTLEAAWTAIHKVLPTVTIAPLTHGTGAWMQFRSASALGSVFTAQEDIHQAAAVALGWVLEQTEVWSVTTRELSPKARPENIAIEVLLPKGQSRASLDAAYQRAADGSPVGADGVSALVSGYSPITSSDGREGIRLVVRGDAKTAVARQEQMVAVQQYIDEGLRAEVEASGATVGYTRAVIYVAKNDWTQREEMRRRDFEGKPGWSYEEEYTRLTGRDISEDLGDAKTTIRATLARAIAAEENAVGRGPGTAAGSMGAGTQPAAGVDGRIRLTHASPRLLTVVSPRKAGSRREGRLRGPERSRGGPRKAFFGVNTFPTGGPLLGAPRIEGATGPDPGLVAVAESYAASIGITLGRQAEFVNVNPEFARRIAQAYDEMKHDPSDPDVALAYQELIQQTMAQYRALEAAGYRFWFFDENTDPYAGNPWGAMRDLRENRAMAVFATEAGFGSGATDIDVSDNPLMADTGLHWPAGSPNGPMKRVLANDLFRAVHDAFGHGLEGAGFRARGEENAWQAHARLFTGRAVHALTTETRGQNSWLNFGPFGERNATARVEDTVFADQKTGLLPSWAWTENVVATQDANGYRVEEGLKWKYQHVAYVLPGELYNIDEDPLNLLAIMEQDMLGVGRVDRYEEIIKLAGFRGMWQRGERDGGSIAVLFDDITVEEAFDRDGTRVATTTPEIRTEKLDAMEGHPARDVPVLYPVTPNQTIGVGYIGDVGSPAFDQWAKTGGGDVVRGSDGAPLLLYRGSGSAARMSFAGVSGHGQTADTGVWMTVSPYVAASYANRHTAFDMERAREEGREPEVTSLRALFERAKGVSVTAPIGTVVMGRPSDSPIRPDETLSLIYIKGMNGEWATLVNLPDSPTEEAGPPRELDLLRAIISDGQDMGDDYRVGGVTPVYARARNTYTVDFEGRSWTDAPIALSDEHRGNTTNEIVRSIFRDKPDVDHIVIRNVVDPGVSGGDSASWEPTDVHVIRDGGANLKSPENYGQWSENPALLAMSGTPSSSARRAYSFEPTRDGAGVASTPALLGPVADRTAAPRIGDDAQLVSIARQFIRLMDLTARQGRFTLRGKNIMGQYSGDDGVIRLRYADDVSTLFHEAGHGINDIMDQPLAGILNMHSREVRQAGTLLYGGDLSKASRRTHMREGFAELFRLYVQNPQKARLVAPAFMADFEAMMQKEAPKIVAGIDKIRQLFNAYLGQTSLSTVRSLIAPAKRPGFVQRVMQDFKDKGFRDTYGLYRDIVISHSVDRFANLRQLTANLMNMVEISQGEVVDILASHDPYKLARTRAGSGSRAMSAMVHGVTQYRELRTVSESLFEAVRVAHNRPDGGTMEDIDEQRQQDFAAYLAAKRALAEYERYRGGELKRPPVQTSEGDLTLAVNELEAQYGDAFVRGASIADAYARALWDKQYSAGLMTREAYERGLGRSFYVPLLRDMSDKQGPIGAAMRHMVGRRRPVLNARFKGSDRLILDPIVALMQKTIALEEAISKNDTKLALARLASAGGIRSGQYVERVPAHVMERIQISAGEVAAGLARQGEMEDVDIDDMMMIITAYMTTGDMVNFFRADQASTGTEPIVFFYENGKLAAMQINDTDVADDIVDLLDAVGYEVGSAMLEVLSLGARAFSLAITRWPDFLFVNFVRDQLSAWAATDVGYIPFVSGFGGARDELLQRQSAQLYNRMGGILGGALSAAGRDQAKVADIKALKGKGYAVRTFNGTSQGIVGGLAHVSELSETSTRLGLFRAAYERALADGLSEYDAAFEATYLATDYMDYGLNGGGAGVTAARRIIPFLNATVAGLYKFTRVLGNTDVARRKGLHFAIAAYFKNENKLPLTRAERQAVRTGRKAWIKVTLLGTLGLALTAAFYDDEAYKSVSEHTRATNWIIPVGGKVVLIPKPFEWAFMSTLFERSYEASQGDTEAWARIRRGLAFQFNLPHANPILQTINEWRTNYDSWTGAEILPDWIERGTRAAPELAVNAYTSQLAIDIGSVTGWRPIMVDHFLQGLGGSAARDISTLYGSATGADTPAMSLSEAPIFRRFFRNTAAGSVVLADFWKQLGSVDGRMTDMSAAFNAYVERGDVGSAENVLTRNDVNDEERAFVYLNSAGREAKDKRMSPMRNAQDAIRVLSAVRRDITLSGELQLGDGTSIILTPQQRREVIDELGQISIRTARNALVAVGASGWSHLEPVDMTDPFSVLREMHPTVAEALEARYTKARVYDHTTVYALWPEVRTRLLTDGASAMLEDMRPLYAD